MTEVYRDEVCYAVINEAPAALGHIKVYPVADVGCLEDLKAADVAHLFTVASTCASIIFQAMQPQGTNIICRNKKDKDVCIEVITRQENDDLKMVWEPKPGDRDQVRSVASEIQKAIVPVEQPQKGPIRLENTERIGDPPDITDQPGEMVKQELPTPPYDADEKKTVQDSTQKEEEVKDLRIQHLRRIP
ncbi:MAG: HIT family protein [Nanoarchaeota archaeon]